jgi:hypothetical protein
MHECGGGLRGVATLSSVHRLDELLADQAAV